MAVPGRTRNYPTPISAAIQWTLYVQYRNLADLENARELVCARTGQAITFSPIDLGAEEGDHLLQGEKRTPTQRPLTLGKLYNGGQTPQYGQSKHGIGDTTRDTTDKFLDRVRK